MRAGGRVVENLLGGSTGLLAELVDFCLHGSDGGVLCLNLFEMVGNGGFDLIAVLFESRFESEELILGESEVAVLIRLECRFGESDSGNNEWE